MAKVQISMDETYHSMIYPYREDDHDDFPAYYLPVEVPDDLLAAYEEARKKEQMLRNYIVNLYGESPINPTFAEEQEAYYERHRADPDPDADDSPWAEYVDDL